MPRSLRAEMGLALLRQATGAGLVWHQYLKEGRVEDAGRALAEHDRLQRLGIQVLEAERLDWRTER